MKFFTKFLKGKKLKVKYEDELRFWLKMSPMVVSKPYCCASSS